MSTEGRWAVPTGSHLRLHEMRITNHWKEFLGFVALAISALFTPLEG